jgi:hypothetical protein
MCTCRVSPATPLYPLRLQVEFQTVEGATDKDGQKIFSERLLRCGVDPNFPCNPSFDTRPYIKGLDTIG